MSDSEEDSYIPGVGDFLKAHNEIFAIMGIFGTVSVFLSQSEGVLIEPFDRVGVFVSLIIFLVAGTWIVRESFNSLISHVGERKIRSEIGLGLILFGSFLLSLSIGVSIVDRFESILISLIPFFLIFIGIIGDIHIYPTERYRYEDAESLVPEFSAMLSVLLIVVLFDGLTSLIRYDIGTGFMVGILAIIISIITAIAGHIMLSEALIGIFVFEDLVKAISKIRKTPRILPTPVVIMFLIGISYAFTFYIMIKKTLYQGDGTFAISYLQWDELLILHWIPLIAISTIVIWLGESRINWNTVDNISYIEYGNYDICNYVYHVFGLVWVILLIVEFIFIQMGWVNAYGISI